MSGEIGSPSGRGGHAGVTFPAGGADLAVLFVELERVDHAQHLVDVAAERQVVDHLVADDALLVDEEGAAQGDAAVAPARRSRGDDLLQVRDQRVLDVADAALARRGFRARRSG